MIKFKIDKYARGEDSPIVTIEVVKQTEKTYTFMEKSWSSGKMVESNRVTMASNPIYDTFDAAKAEYIRQRQEWVEIFKKRVSDAKSALEHAEKLLAAAPYIKAPEAQK